MRLAQITLVATSITLLAACGSGGGGGAAPMILPSAPAQAAPAATVVEAWKAPDTYSKATKAATTLGGCPGMPDACKPINVRGTPGTVIVDHSVVGDREYTANANGVFVGNNTAMNMLVPARTTLWFTVKSPVPAGVTWTGVDFISSDEYGATYTVPEGCSSSDPVLTIQITVIPLPKSAG